MLKSAKFLVLVSLALLAFSITLGTLSGTPGHDPIHIRIDYHTVTQDMKRQQILFKEIDCLARNVYYEARGESKKGQLAVAQVTLNRVESGMFPDSICGVVNERYMVKGREVCQFSWRCDPNANKNLLVSESNPIFQLAWLAIRDYHKLSVVTHDTYWFHADYVRPAWRKFKERVAQIDDHIFYRQKQP